MSVPHSSPSGDESRLDRAIAEFLIAESAGKAGDRQLWLERFPECATGLADFFDDLDQVDGFASPLRLQPVTPSSAFTSSQLDFSQNADHTIDFTPQPPQFTSNRYRTLRYHAGGGMGEIWLAKDARVGRHVALKKLRTGRNIDHSRFFVEAQITGQLEHPNIVPLHDLGFDDAGNPYYVMKFIRGRRLREAIREFHVNNESTDWAENVEFHRLLEALVSICNVVAYAHSKGVLHRDIKPDNVLLGAYGETIVVDWGLAKVIGESQGEPGSRVSLSASGSTATQDGAIVGSPYYMPPEGAEGHPDAIDQTSDVYLLGATLYEVLTGRPPRQGSTSLEVIDLARNSHPANPRKINPRIARPIESICLKAMAFGKRDRYQTPLEFAADIERYMAGAPVSAFKEPLQTRVWRWMRRHRRGIAAAAVVLGSMVLGNFAWQNAQEARLLAARESARGQLAEFYRNADEAQFFAASTDAPSERVPYYDARRADEAGRGALAIAAPWGDHADQLPFPAERVTLLDAQYSLLLLLAQNRLMAQGNAADPRAALKLLDRAGSLATPSRSLYQLRGRAHQQLGNLEAAASDERLSRDAGTTVTAQDLFLQGEMLRTQDTNRVAAILDGDTSSAPKHLDEAIAQYQAALKLDPKHYWARYQVGRCLLAAGHPREAIEALSACIAIRPSAPWAHSTRGLAYALAAQPRRAIDDLKQAVALDPDFQPARLNRGAVNFWLLGNVDEAMEDFNRLLTAPIESRLTEAAFCRGQALLEQEKFHDALADFDSTIATQPEFAPAYWMRAKASFLMGNFQAGLVDVETFLRMCGSHPSSQDIAGKHFVLGKALRMMGQQLRGEPRNTVLSRAADELSAAIAAGPPTSDTYQQLGAVEELLGKRGLAIESYSKGLSIAPNDVSLHLMRGWAHANQHEFAEAEADFEQAIRDAPRNSEAHAGLGFVLADQHRFEDAQREAATALLFDDSNHLTYHYVACIFARLSAAQPDRRLEQENLALAALDRAVAISKTNPTGQDAGELTLIRSEDSFPDSLRGRPEFKQLIGAAPATNR